MTTAILDNLTNYIESTGIPYKIREGEIVLQYCPYCEGPDKKGYDHFYFNIEKKTFYCHKCGCKGNLYKFKLDRGDISPITKAREIEHKKPRENKELTFDTGKFYQWYDKERGIKPEILEKYKVGFQGNNGKLTIIYQYYAQNNVLFNRKYRSQDKKMWTEKNAESNFYGLQFVDFSKPYLHICEGEDDCHSLIQLGFDNVVSVPYGAGTYTPFMHKVIQQFSELILLFDNDPRGQDGARKFAEKAGLAKCKNVILPYKDARECLLNDLDIFDIQKEITAGQPFKHEEIIKPNDIKAGYMKFVNNMENLIGRAIRIPDFNRIVGGIRPSELTVLTGHTGRGKSTFAYNYVRWAEEVGFCCMVMSFENRLFPVITKLIEIYSEEQIRMFDTVEGRWKLLQADEWINHQYDRLNQREIYFLNKSKHVKDGYYSLQRLGDIIDYATKFYNVNVFIIDHLHYFLKVSDARNPVMKIDESMRQIKQWTLKYNIHILLLVHPSMTKDKAGNLVKLGLNSGKGASSISQESDNFWVVSRKEEEGRYYSKLEILKNREMGKTGTISFRVLDNLNTYISE